ncbi:major facilitator superfamily domain-containing protein 6 [Trichonephila clavata]|uniref:Major facilitator superfamily domain-containing protein 6 n=1 Tax=Trichonephila clavata TaxID=2740835 RepID=A0A8X6J7B5_TRICU|nr:major facilitator superfamily domain-containing protein 6 [Trichonephila clavata]
MRVIKFLRKSTRKTISRVHNIVANLQEIFLQSQYLLFYQSLISKPFRQRSCPKFTMPNSPIFESPLYAMEEVDAPQEKEESTFRKLLPIKAHYVLIFGGSSAIFPYVYIYAKTLGITADAVGYITATLWCATVLTRPVLGGLADYFQKFKLVLTCMLVISVASALGLSFIPQPPQQASNSTTNSSVICLQNNSYLVEFEVDTCASDLCSEKCTFSCYLCGSNYSICTDTNTSLFIQSEYSETESFDDTLSDCPEKLNSKCTTNSATRNCINITVKDSGDSVVVQNAPLQLGLFSVFALMFFVCQTTVESLSDAACGNALEGKMELYGRQRMWGTIGWGLFSLLAGYLNHLGTLATNITSYWPGFYMSVVFYTMDIGAIWKIPMKHVKSERNIAKDVGKLLLKPKIVLFILQVTFLGLVRGVFLTYLLWFLESLGASQLLLGSITAIQSFLGEVIFMFIAAWIIRKIGHLNVFALAFVAHGARFFAYAFLKEPLWGLLIEVLQGPAYGSFFAALTSYVRLLAPTGAEATVQGVALAALEGVGMSLGNVLGGYWVHNLGVRDTFFWSGVLCMIFGMISCIISGLVSCNWIK